MDGQKKAERVRERVASAYLGSRRPMPTQRNTKSKKWAEDGDDSHFSDNPAVRKRTRRKIAGGKIKTGSGASGRTGKYVGGKKRTAKKRVAGK